MKYNPKRKELKILKDYIVNVIKELYLKDYYLKDTEVETLSKNRQEERAMLIRAIGTSRDKTAPEEYFITILSDPSYADCWMLKYSIGVESSSGDNKQIRRLIATDIYNELVKTAGYAIQTYGSSHKDDDFKFVCTVFSALCKFESCFSSSIDNYGEEEP